MNNTCTPYENLPTNVLINRLGELSIDRLGEVDVKRSMGDDVRGFREGGAMTHQSTGLGRLVEIPSPD